MNEDEIYRIMFKMRVSTRLTLKKLLEIRNLVIKGDVEGARLLERWDLANTDTDRDDILTDILVRTKNG